MIHPLRQRLPLLLLTSLLLWPLFSGCARFRVEELDANRLLSIPFVGADEENPHFALQPLQSGRVIYNFPRRIIHHDNRVYIADPARGIIRVHNLSGNTVAIIGNPQLELPDTIRHIPFELGSPHLVAVDDQGQIHIEVRPRPESIESASPAATEIPAHERFPAQLSARYREFAPSHIVVLSSSYEPLRLIGENGGSEGSALLARLSAGDMPEGFGLIERIDAEGNGRLYVQHRFGDKRTLSVFDHSELVTRIEAPHQRDFTEEEKRRCFIDAEKIVPVTGGDFYYASVACRNPRNYQLLFRRIYRIEAMTLEFQQMLTTEEPNDYFGWSRPDNGFYMVNNEEDGSKVLFKIFSPEGEYLNNRLINFPDIRASWRETYVTLPDSIYTSRIYQGQLQLYEWL